MISKEYLDNALQTALRESMRANREYMDARFRENTRDIIQHFNESFDQRLSKVEGKLDKVEERFEKVEESLGSVEERLGSVEERIGHTEGAIHNLIATVATRDDMRNLVTEIQRHGMMIEEKRIFTQ